MIRYEVYPFRPPDNVVVYAPVDAPREISLVKRQGDGRWHCALCDSTGCRHARAAEESRATP